MPIPSFYYQEKLQRLSDSYLEVFIKKLEKKLNKPIEEVTIDESGLSCYEPENLYLMAKVPVIDSSIFKKSYKGNEDKLDEWCDTIYERLRASSKKIMFFCPPEFSPYLTAVSNNKGIYLVCSYGGMLGHNIFFLDIRISFIIVDKLTEEASND